MTKHRNAIRAALEWLSHAQDQAGDGGVAAWYSLINGWQPSYIETTGYIINTYLDCFNYFGDKDLYHRAIKMADFLITMQHANGGYRGVVPRRARTSKPVIFNTGQDILGMAHVYIVTKEKKYLDSVTKAANFLVKNQALDGSWIKYNYGNKNHVYDTRVAWALLIVSQLFTQLRKPKKAEVYKHAAVKNLDWALTFQQKNGWFRNNELPPPNIQLPYTHTISYALEGFLWSALITKKRKYLNAAIAGALPIAEYYLKHDFIPGTFDYQWQSQDTYTCLTGDAQLALVWLTLYERTKNPIFKKAGYRINAYLRKIQNTQTSNKNIRGGISGSWPLWGDVLQNKGYCRLAYINWGAKFFIDAQLKELHLREQKK